MGSRKLGQDTGPPDPVDASAPGLRMPPCSEREEDAPRAPCAAACAAAAAGGLRRRALLVLAVCLSATLLPYGMGSLAALSQSPPASPHLPPAQPGHKGYRNGVSDDLVTVSRDPRTSPVRQQPETALVGSAGTFPAGEGDSYLSADAESWDLGTLTGDTAVPSTPQTLPAPQPGALTGGVQESGVATVAVMLSKALEYGMETPAKLSPEVQSSPGDDLTTGWSHPGSHSGHGASLGSLLSKGAGLHSTTQLPVVAVASAHRREPGSSTESMRTRPRSSPFLSSKVVPSISSEHMSEFPSKSQSQRRRSWGTLWPLRMPHQNSATVESSTAALDTQPWVPTPSRASSGTEEQPAVKPQKAWGTHPAHSFLHGEAAPTVNTVLAKVLRNGSSLLVAASALPPMDVSAARGVKHQHMLSPSHVSEELGGSAVTAEKQGDLSPRSIELITCTSADGLPSSSLASGTRAASDPTAAVSSAAFNSVSEPRVPKTSHEDGAAAPPSLKAVDVTDTPSLSLLAEMPSLHPKHYPTVSFVTAGTPEQGRVAYLTTEVAGRSVLPAEAAKAEDPVSGKPGMTSGDAAAALSGPPEPPQAVQSSAPPSSLKLPTPAHQPESEPETWNGITGFSPLSYEPSSTTAMHGPKSLLTARTMTAPAGFMPGTQPMPTAPAVAPQHPFTAGEDLSVAAQPTPAGESFMTTASPAEPGTTGKRSSPGVQPAVSQGPGLPSPARPLPVHVLPLRFRLSGIAYTKALSSKSSESYKALEEEVLLMLNKTLSTYENFLQANILEFMNGSVIVQGEALFRGDSPAPTNSHLIRTILTEVSRERDTLSWQVEPWSIQSGGFSLENLDPEKLSVSLTVLRLGSVASGGMSRTDPLDRLINEVIQSLHALYDVKNFTIAQFRNLRGDLEISGELYLDTDVHADIDEVLEALKALATLSVDMASLSVEGAKLQLKTYPISFLVTNRHFSEDLLDPFSVGYQELARELGDVVERALKNHSRLLQAVIRGFLPGSLICHGDVIFQDPAPTSREVLEALAVSVGPDKALAGSGFQVDPYSLAVGEDTLEPPPADSGFPDYGVVIIVMCGLGIITIPVILLVCLRNQCFGWQDVAALWDRRDPEAGTQTMEMENQGFWAGSDEGPEDGQQQWQKSSA